MNENFLPKKKVNKSLRERGFSIPADLQGIFFTICAAILKIKLGGKLWQRITF